MLPTKFSINWPFGSAEEAKNRFSRWRSSISDQNISAIFDLQGSDTSYQVSSQLVQGCRRSRLLKQLLTLDDTPQMRHKTNDAQQITDTD